MDQRRELEAREGPPLGLERDATRRAFQDDRPPPSTGGPFVWQYRVTRAPARLRQGSFQRIPFVGQHVAPLTKRFGGVPQLGCSLPQPGDRLPNQLLPPFPSLRIRDSRLAGRLKREAAPICL